MAALTAALLGLAGASAINAFKGSGTQQTPTPVAPPAAPVPDFAAQDKLARDAAKLATAKASLAPGRRSTLLTGPSGVTGPATVAPHSLLGQ